MTFFLCSGILCLISIHAPARGATLFWFFLTVQVHHFNPRSREGSDSNQFTVLTSHQNFNPRSREGSDSAPPVATIIIETFQSTLPRGERRHILGQSRADMLFQSTLPRGERRRFSASCGGLEIFQSTLPRGERLQFYLKFTLCF